MSAYDLPPKPGTYRITNVLTSTVIEVPDYNQDRATSRTWHHTSNQHWVIQYSGRGYKIKNCRHGVYLFASSSKEGSVVGAAATPTVWTLLRTQAGFVIQYEEEDRAVNLHFASGGDNNVLLLWKSGDCPPHRRWKFEQISDDTGGEVAETIENEVDRLKRELGERNAQLEEKDAQLALQTEELAKKDRQLAEKDRTLAAQAAALCHIGSPECTASKMVEIYGKLDELRRIEREVCNMMDGLRAECIKQLPNNTK
ncbi:hypothetical protein FRC08_001190 [Ceratobasidium sp. 394]|nr:hypothetical protein FRC08_001190 [Ceratobasidium sp. 394]KAG9088804.1 hypothetical protein FS749_001857 [Ceratobasidium sp. UAMH 11750]